MKNKESFATNCIKKKGRNTTKLPVQKVLDKR